MGAFADFASAFSGPEWAPKWKISWVSATFALHIATHKYRSQYFSTKFRLVLGLRLMQIFVFTQAELCWLLSTISVKIIEVDSLSSETSKSVVRSLMATFSRFRVLDSLVKFLLIFKFANHRTKEPFVSPTGWHINNNRWHHRYLRYMDSTLWLTDIVTAKSQWFSAELLIPITCEFIYFLFVIGGRCVDIYWHG